MEWEPGRVEKVGALTSIARTFLASLVLQVVNVPYNTDRPLTRV
jgi:hypothetical protein